MATHPIFVILPSPIPISELDELLGRFVVDIFSPLDLSAPKTVSDITYTHALVPITAEDLTITLNSIHNESAIGRLQKVLEIAAKKGWNQKLNIESSKVETRRLKDHDEVFEGVTGYKGKWREIAKLFKYSKSGMAFWRKQVYMIVGVKVLTDPSVTFERTDKSSAEAKATVPADKIADSFAPESGRLVPNPEAELKREDELGQTFKTKTKNEQQIFAVEYRVITRSVFAKKENASATKIGPKIKFNWGNGVMGDGDEDDNLPEELIKNALESPNTVAEVSAGVSEFWFKAE